MSLTLITGLANAGKTGRILRDVRGDVAMGESPQLVVPSLADVRRLETEFASNTPLGIRVSTLDAFKADLWQLHGDGRHLVGRHWREATLRRLVDEGVQAEIADAAATPGFVRFLSRAVRESEGAGPGPDPGVTSRLKSAISSLLKRYATLAEAEGVVEESWLGQLLATAGPRLEGRLGITRFDRLEPCDAQLLVALSQCNRVSVSLTWEEGFAPTRGNDDVVALFAGVADEHDRLAQPAAVGEIQTLAHRLYSGPTKLESSQDVVAGMAAGTDAETALVARFASREIARGTARERIAIAFPSVSKRAASLSRALEAEGVSASIEFRIDLSETRFGRALLGLLTLALGGGGRPEALAYLFSPFSGVNRQVARAIDVSWREHRVVEPRALLSDLTRVATEAGFDLPQLARAAARGALTPESLSDWLKLTDSLLAMAWRSAEDDPGLADIRTDVAAHQAVTRALGETASQQAGGVAGRDVAAALCSLSVRISAEETEGSVQVCDFQGVGSRRFDSLILGGLTEGEIPLRAGESPGDDFEADVRSSREGEHADRVRLEFYSLLTRARDRLYLVRQDADSEGKECRASALWEDVLDVYRAPGAEFEQESESPIPCERITRADVEDSAPSMTVGARERRALASVMSVGSAERETLSSAASLSAVRSRTAHSATEIETYLECPYRWFFERVIRPREVDATLDAREVGSHAHRILAAFYRRLGPETGHDRVSTEWLGEAMDLFDEVVAADGGRAMQLLGLSEELADARSVEWARSTVGEDAFFLPGFVPSQVEMEFGGDTEPFVFAGSAFRGRIDRVDTSGACAFVTDYKSASEVPGIAAFERAAKVQAVVYACAAEERLGLPVSGSAYRSLRSGHLRGFWRRDLLGEMPRGMCEADGLDAEEFAALIARTERRVAEAVDGMHAGRIPRVPAVAGACNYCALTAFCERASR